MNDFCSIQIQLLTGTTLGNRPDIQQLLTPITPGTYTPPPDTSFVTLCCSLNPSGDIWCAQKHPIGSSDAVRALVSSQHGTLAGLFRSIGLQHSSIYFYGIFYLPPRPLVDKILVGYNCGTRSRISGTSVADILIGPRFGCSEASCTSRGRNSARKLIRTRLGFGRPWTRSFPLHAPP